MFSDQLNDDQLHYTHGRPVCRECLGETLRDQESGEDVCVRCGAVVGVESVLAVPASRAAIERSLALGSSPIMRDDLELPTVVGAGDYDAKGRPLSNSHELRQLRRLGAMVSWDPKRKRLARVSTEIRRIAEALALGGNVVARAYEIYSKSFDQGSRVTSVPAAATAAVCVACLELEIPRPPDDIIALKLNVDERKLRYHYKILVKSVCTNNIPNPTMYVSSIAARASLDGVTERRALEILARTKGRAELVGKRPVSIAAAALYLASLETKDQTTQMRLAFAARVSPMTVRKCGVQLSKLLGQVGPDTPTGQEKANSSSQAHAPVQEAVSALSG